MWEYILVYCAGIATLPALFWAVPKLQDWMLRKLKEIKGK